MTPRPQAFVLVATDHGPMIVNRNDFHRLPDGGTYGVGWQLLTFSSYDPSEVAEVLEILRKRREKCGDGVMALDCGANIGVHTVEMAKYMTGWGEVFAFEAQSRLYYALCGNIALNNLENATAYWVALGKEPGTIDIPRPNYNKPASFGSLELKHNPNNEYIGQAISYNTKNCVRVNLNSLDSYSFNRLDFIKLDVEGMELDILEGAKKVIKQFRPHMLIEWIKTPRAELEKALTLLGYSFVERGGNLLAEPIE